MELFSPLARNAPCWVKGAPVGCGRCRGQVFRSVPTCDTFAPAYMLRGRAARHGEMNLTQSRVSQLLKELEAGLEVALFSRISKRLTPTPAGRKFIDAAASFIERLDTALREVSDASNEERGHLRLGVVPACNGHFMPEILGRPRAAPRLPCALIPLTSTAPRTPNAPRPLP